MTHRSAEEDIMRLKEHLITKRVETFVKNLGEVLEVSMPPSKRRRFQVHKIAVPKIISGHCLAQ